MLTTINDAFLAIADPLLAWLPWLPTDMALILVSVATGAVLTFARPWTTNQDLLRRCHQDKGRLKQLIREARREQDKGAVLVGDHQAGRAGHVVAEFRGLHREKIHGARRRLK